MGLRQSGRGLRWLLLLALVTGLSAQGAVAARTGNAIRPDANAHRSEIAAAPELQSIHSILAAGQEQAGARVQVRGTVTYLGDPGGLRDLGNPGGLGDPGEMVLQDQTGAVLVDPIALPQAVLGDEVEVMGTNTLEEGVHHVSAATVRSLWHSSSPPPIALAPDDAAAGDHNHYLVQTEGKLLRVEQGPDGTRLQMQGDHQFFNAVLAKGMLPGEDGRGSSKIASLQPNSILRLTGILVVPTGQYNPARGSFLLLMRSPDDFGVLQNPPWGTTPHILLLIAGLIAVAAAVQMVHVRSVRRQFAAILAERARIARDIHDTLAQGFAGIALQLEVVKGDLGSNDRKDADLHLEMALGMVRHSRAEAHQSIATLRAFARPVELPDLLRTMAAGMVSRSRTAAHFHLPPLEDTPSQEVAEHLFRICQEAVANALQHAAARNLWVSLEQTAEGFALSVRDDGHGFAVGRERAPTSAESGALIHFGLVGMEERAARLQGNLELSSSEAGTLVAVTIPVQARARRWWRRPVVRSSRVQKATPGINRGVGRGEASV